MLDVPHFPDSYAGPLTPPRLSGSRHYHFSELAFSSSRDVPALPAADLDLSMGHAKPDIDPSAPAYPQLNLSEDRDEDEGAHGTGADGVH
jgi:hypothetical protein